MGKNSRSLDRRRIFVTTQTLTTRPAAHRYAHTPPTTTIRIAIDSHGWDWDVRVEFIIVRAVLHELWSVEVLPPPLEVRGGINVRITRIHATLDGY